MNALFVLNLTTTSVTLKSKRIFLPQGLGNDFVCDKRLIFTDTLKPTVYSESSNKMTAFLEIQHS